MCPPRPTTNCSVQVFFFCHLRLYFPAMLFLTILVFCIKIFHQGMKDDNKKKIVLITVIAVIAGVLVLAVSYYIHKRRRKSVGKVALLPS